MGKVTDELKRSFRHGDMGVKLIWINAIVFVAFTIVKNLLLLFNVQVQGLDILSLPASLTALCHRPWTLVTYMFMHANLWHILMNMLWLYWFGRLFLFFFSARHLRGLYVVGGLGGALLFLAAYNLLPYFTGHVPYSTLVGASAAILAIVVAVAVKEPDYGIHLMLLGRVPLKYIALIAILCDVLFIGGTNAGGHIAHLGGALTGWWFAEGLRKGYDITEWANKVMDFVAGLFVPARKKTNLHIRKTTEKSRKKSNKRSRRDAFEGHYQKDEKTRKSSNSSGNFTSSSDTSSTSDNARVDRILEKIKQSGYAALTDEEKRILFDASKK